MHTETVMVYFEDLDAMGVVHNGRYATLLERALAGHSPVRPNHLGVSRCALLAVAGLELTVRGLDAVDGTPVPRE